MINFTRLFTKTEYTVAYRFSKEGLLKDTETPFETLKLSDKNRWFADPFIYSRGGKTYVFMEIFQKDKNYAGIGYSELVDGKLTEPRIVIDTGYHMSFPLIIEYNDRILMIPEISAVGKVSAFECVDFPDKWVESDCIIDREGLYDSVVFDYQNEYYMFTSAFSGGVYGSKLFLIKLKEDGAFLKEAERKEISEDYKISREAGKMLCCGGCLYRVAQDCSNNDYGRALEFLKVENMSVDGYSEKMYKEINVSDIKTVSHVRGIAGTHTYNRDGEFEVIDFKLCTFSLKSTLQKIKIIFDIIIGKIRH